MTGIQYNLPMERYLAAPGISKSLLDKFRRCPLEAWEHQQGLLKDEPTPAMLMGKLTDEAIFNPSNATNLYYVYPETYEAIVKKKVVVKDWSGNATYCKQWKAKHSDRTCITSEEERTLFRMVDAVHADKDAAALLKGAQYQVSLFAKHDRTGLLRKGRPDGMAARYILDLKKVVDAHTDALSKAIGKYYWYVQAAYYIDLANALGQSIDDFYFIAVEESERPKVNVRRLRQHAIDLGRWVYERDLHQYSECNTAGNWPGYGGVGDSIEYIDVPHWEEAKVKGELEEINLEA